MGFTAISQEPMAGFWSCLVFSIIRRVSIAEMEFGDLDLIFKVTMELWLYRKIGFTAISQEPMDGFWSFLVFSIIRRVTIAERNLVTLNLRLSILLILPFWHTTVDKYFNPHNYGTSNLMYLLVCSSVAYNQTCPIYFITKTRLYNFDPLKPHFYKVKLGFTGVYIIFLISAQKHRLWVLVRTASSRRF